MKLITFCLLVSMASVTANSYSQLAKFTLNLENRTVGQVFQEIENTSEFIFIYSEKSVDVNRKVDLKVEDETVNSILDQLFKETNNSYEIHDRQIVILSPEVTELLPLMKSGNEVEQPQKKEISGTVRDIKGQPLPGATIIAKGTTIGIITDVDGKFTLIIPVDVKTLSFSFMGMVTQEIIPGKQTNLEITLKEAAHDVSEVLVVGYGIQKKQSIVGSIATVSEKDLKQRGGVSNLAQALSGQMAGVVVQEISGEPGRNDPMILIRGMSTWNGSQPLILVDGVERKMSDIDINEVDNISVLKDASATAVFGVKGANGVILVTTKRGDVGKSKLSMTASTGWEGVSKINGVMEAYEAQGWRNAAIEREVSSNESSWAYYIPNEQRLRSKKPQVAPYTYLYPNIDWPDVMLKKWAKNSRVNMNLNGGTDFAKYFASVGYTHEGDLMKSHYNTAKKYDPGYSYDRFNFRGNVDFKLTNTTTLSANISGYWGKRKSPGSNFGSSTAHIFRGIYELAPDAFPVQYEDGTYGKNPANLNRHNPLALLLEGGTIINLRRQISNDVKLNQKLDFITKGLSASANVSYDEYMVSTGNSITDAANQGQAKYSYIDKKILDAKTHQDSLEAQFYYISANKTGFNDFDWVMKPWTVASEAVTSGSLQRSLFYQGSINYARVFGKHDVTALALFNRMENATGGTFPNYREDWVGRVTYNYENKYFAEFNGAYNGSEKFITKYRFGFFPSIALGWMISNEKFMKKFEWIDKFKIRGSIGKIGSDAGIPRWGYTGSWTAGGTGTPYTTFDANGTIVNSPYSTYKEGTIPNADIRWETAIKRNIAIELSLLKRLITIDVDVFKDNRKDIFMEASRRNIPDYFGASAVAANLGETQTQGYEIQFGINKTYRDWGFWMKLMISEATDLITKGEDPQLLSAYQKVVGYPISQTKTQMNTRYMNNWDQVYASSPATANMVYRSPGDWDINDFNVDGIINTYDIIPLGYTQRPQNTYSTSLGFSYKNFSCMVQFYGQKNITLQPDIIFPVAAPWVNVSEEVRDYWTPQNTDAYYQAPRFITSSAGGNWINQDGSFLRLKTAEVAYNLPENLVKIVGLSNCRVYLNGNNLLLWSKLPADFETGSLDISNAYPTYRTITLGIDVKF